MSVRGYQRRVTGSYIFQTRQHTNTMFTYNINIRKILTPVTSNRSDWNPRPSSSQQSLKLRYPDSRLQRIHAYYSNDGSTIRTTPAISPTHATSTEIACRTVSLTKAHTINSTDRPFQAHPFPNNSHHITSQYTHHSSSPPSISSSRASQSLCQHH